MCGEDGASLADTSQAAYLSPKQCTVIIPLGNPGIRGSLGVPIQYQEHSEVPTSDKAGVLLPLGWGQALGCFQTVC